MKKNSRQRMVCAGNPEEFAQATEFLGTRTIGHLQYRAVVLLVMLMLATAAVVAQDAAPQPISATQLRLLLEEKKTGDAQTPRMHAQLEKKRATLPAWFPAAVWDEVERKVEAIPFADVALPTYQKYMTSEQADVDILIYQGPTGQQIATILAGRADATAEAGFTGSASDREVEKTLQGDTAIQALFARRLAEMSPEDRAHVQAMIPGIRAITPRIEDESDAAYNRKANEVVQQVVASRKAEISKAQAAASRPTH